MGRIGLKFLAFLCLLLVASVPGLADGAPAAATLTVRVGNVSPRGGVLRMGLYDAARYKDDKADALMAADVPVTLGETVVVFRNVPPGRYAIETFQDINANGKMDTSLLGLPLEPYGFSRDARPFLSKPGFGRVAFDLPPGATTLTLHLQNSQPQMASR